MRARPRAAVVGAGRLARVLAPALRRLGYGPVLVLSPGGRSARTLARGRRGLLAGSLGDPLPGDVRLVVLAVPDGQLPGAARALARQTSGWRGRVALHTAGALGRGPLAILARRGAATGVFHPLQVLGGDPEAAAARLRGSLARVEGSGRARTWAARLARELGLRPVTASRRGLYHAAASLGANDLVALLDLSIEALAASGVPAARAREGILALAAGALAQARAGGLRAALTGPVPRGDAKTLARHLRALRSHPAAREAHLLLSRRLAGLASEAGLLDRPARAAIDAALSRRR